MLVFSEHRTTSSDSHNHARRHS